jgi:cystinosin
MNFLRKSTDGFSIGTILLDFSGGIFNYSQMVVQSIDQGLWFLQVKIELDHVMKLSDH